MQPNPMQPMHLAITRPQAAAKQLAAFIEQQQDHAHFVSHITPGIIIQAADDQAGLKHACLTMQQADNVIFLSPAAVQHSACYLQPAPVPQRIIAIGAATQRCLQKIWQSPPPEILIPKHASSEGLLAMPALSHCQGQHIMVFATKRGRQLLFKQLHQRAAKVQHVIAYQQTQPSQATILKLTQLLQHKTLDLCIITSCQALQNLITGLAPQDRALLQSTPSIVTSQRIKNYAAEQGLKQITIAKSAAHADIYATIKKLKACNKSSASKK